MYEAGILALMGWWYHGWKGDPNARVDLIFPCFFPLGVAVLVNAYEMVSFSCLDRRRPINVIAVCFDVLICAGSTFCFLLLGLIDNDPVQDRLRTDSTRERWRRDQSKAMIFMIVFCFLHALFIIMASVGCVYSGILKNRARRRRRIARNRAQMARFADERRRQMDVDKAQVGAPVEDVGQREERSAERNSRGTESTYIHRHLHHRIQAHAITGTRPGEDATPGTPLHPYPLQNMFSKVKKLSAKPRNRYLPAGLLDITASTSSRGVEHDVNFCASPTGPAPNPNETEEQRKRRLRKEEEKKKEKFARMVTEEDKWQSE
ncbi:hypothetical protein QR685DRAFT_567970 [Neurospora intermedia]|uniref:MARVEL domain-containing protein n=1 Tax=Neurospora intermedia TaxID=5142 RepID=A0ABR3DR24_NEUIN